MIPCFDTAFRILETLKLLSNENLSKPALIKKLSEGDKTNIYTYEAFIKYFNTLNLLGLLVEKDRIEYSLKNAILNKLIKFFFIIHHFKINVVYFI